MQYGNLEGSNVGCGLQKQKTHTRFKNANSGDTGEQVQVRERFLRQVGSPHPRFCGV